MCKQLSFSFTKGSLQTYKTLHTLHTTIKWFIAFRQRHFLASAALSRATALDNPKNFLNFPASHSKTSFTNVASNLANFPLKIKISLKNIINKIYDFSLCNSGPVDSGNLLPLGEKTFTFEPHEIKVEGDAGKKISSAFLVKIIFK